jgi:ribosomal protein S27E
MTTVRIVSVGQKGKNLRMKCPYCGHWNRVPVNKIFIEQPSSEPKVKASIPMYEPLEVVKCKKCGKVIAELKEPMSITNPTVVKMC